MTSGNVLYIDTAVGETSTANRHYANGTHTVVMNNNDGNINAAQDYMMYAWANKTGVSHFGTYEGSGVLKTVTGVGFSPKFLIIKSIDSANSWVMYDVFRGFGTSNSNNGRVFYPDATQVEGAGFGITVNSAGWSMQHSSAAANASSQDYVYIAFA